MKEYQKRMKLRDERLKGYKPIRYKPKFDKRFRGGR